MARISPVISTDHETGRYFIDTARDHPIGTDEPWEQPFLQPRVRTRDSPIRTARSPRSIRPCHRHQLKPPNERSCEKSRQTKLTWADGVELSAGHDVEASNVSLISSAISRSCSRASLPIAT
jgi:hypothetical protein